MAKDNRYFTAGELAAAYGIPKQTLLYYDKHKLLIPEFINDKGYRFYSELQYHTLEIILNMRKFDIPVQNIKEYLQERNIENFEDILKEKAKEYDRIIKKTINMKNNLQLFLESVERIKQTRIGQVELATQPERKIFGSEILNDRISPKNLLEIFSQHNQAAFSIKSFKEFSTGWIIDKDEFFAEKFNKTLRYFTPVSQSASKGASFFIRAAGLYMTFCFQGTFYQEITNAFKKIQSFMNRNNLKAIDDIYIFPLKNYWFTENTQEYINEISFQVEYLQKENQYTMNNKKQQP